MCQQKQDEYTYSLMNSMTTVAYWKLYDGLYLLNSFRKRSVSSARLWSLIPLNACSTIFIRFTGSLIHWSSDMPILVRSQFGQYILQNLEFLSFPLSIFNLLKHFFSFITFFLHLQSRCSIWSRNSPLGVPLH